MHSFNRDPRQKEFGTEMSAMKGPRTMTPPVSPRTPATVKKSIGRSTASRRQSTSATYKVRRVRALFFTCTVLAIVAAMMGAIALGSVHWFEVVDDWNNLKPNPRPREPAPLTATAMGLFQSCTGAVHDDGTESEDCAQNEFIDQTCRVVGGVVSGNELHTRFDGVAACTFLSTACLLGGAFVALLLGRRHPLFSKKLWITCVLLFAASCTAAGIAIALFAHTMTNWVNCGNGYCAGKPTGCSANFGYSFGLTCGTFAAAFACTVLAYFSGGRKTTKEHTDADDEDTAVVGKAPGTPVNPINMFSGDGGHGAAPPKETYDERYAPQPPAPVPQPPTSDAPARPDIPRAPVPAVTPSPSPSLPTGPIVAPAAPRPEDKDADDADARSRGQVSGISNSTGEWVLDDESQLYWSERQKLFLHPDSGHFFDPETNQWYNPDEGRWYTLTA